MKRYRKDRPWFREDESLPREVRQARRALQESRVENTLRHPGFWRNSR